MLHWGVYFIIFSIFFRSLGTINILGLTLNQFVILFLFFGTLIIRLIRKEDIYRLEGLDIALIVFGLYFWFSNFLISQDSAWGIGISIGYFRALLCYFIVVFLINKRAKVKLLFSTYILASLSIVFTGEFYNVIKSGLTFELYGRSGVAGLADHYNQYALYALISVPLLYFALKNVANKVLKGSFVVASLVLVSAALFSGSRGAVITFIVMACVITALDLFSFKNVKVLHFCLLLLVIVSLFSVFWIKGGRDLLLSLSHVVTVEGPKDHSLSGRLWIAKKSFTIFLENPLFGTGIDSTRAMFDIATHNQWLQILTELGIVGMVLAVLITYFVFHTLFIAKRNSYASNDFLMINIIHGIMVSIFSILFWGLYMNVGLLSENKLLFMLFGLCRSIKNLACEAQELSTAKS